MLTRGDFHIHSTASDGSLTPGEIIAVAKRTGIDTIALADHNTTAGIDEAALMGKQYGVSVIPSVELSTKYNGEGIHLLGYFRDGRYNDRTFVDILRLLKYHKVKEARSILTNFMHINALGDNLSVMEGVNFLRLYGAAVVLAHPVRISKKNILALLNMPFDGLEAKYCHNNYYDTCFFTNTALTRFSFYTGGSDFHSNSTCRQKHCFIGMPCLYEEEIQMFLRNSGATVLS